MAEASVSPPFLATSTSDTGTMVTGVLATSYASTVMVCSGWVRSTLNMGRDQVNKLGIFLTETQMSMT